MDISTFRLGDKKTKRFTHCYQAIQYFTGSQQGIISKENSPIHGLLFEWKKRDKGFQLKLENIPLDVFKKLFSIDSIDNFALDFSNLPNSIDTDLSDIVVDSLSIESRNDTYKRGQFISNSVSGTVRHFSNSSFSSERQAYHRVIFPCSHNPNVEEVLQKETFNIQVNERTYPASPGIMVDLDSHTFHFFELTVDNDHFLIIDSEDLLVWKDFRRYIFSIMMSYGFVSGYFPFREGYFFSNSSRSEEQVDGFAYFSLRGTLRPDNPPITTDPYSRTQIQSVHEEFADKVKPLTAGQFSRLCYEAHYTPEIATAILTYLEASCASFLMQGQSYFVILETLAHGLKKESVKKSFPTLPKSVLKEIRNAINNSADLTDDAKSFFLEKKIKHLNQLPNQKTLEEIFRVLDLELTEEDQKVIKRRNDHLHGRLFPYEETTENIDKNDQDLVYVTKRMSTLIAALLLKYIDYSGWIINYPKIWEKHAKPLPYEQYFRKI